MSWPMRFRLSRHGDADEGMEVETSGRLITFVKSLLGPVLVAQKSTDLIKFFRTCSVSVVVNGVGLVVYFLITQAGTEPKVAATICFALGVAIGFTLNCGWSFHSTANIRHTLPRYVIVYVIAYVADIGGLYAFVDVMGRPHLIVQTCLGALIAMGLFLAQNLWVFRESR